MKLADVQTRLNQLDITAGQDLIYELLAAYGFTQTAITKLRNGTYDQEIDDNRVLWKKRVWDAYLPNADNDELLATLGRAQANNDVSRRKPRFYITRNDQNLNAVDNRTGSTLDTPLSNLANHANFFMPWTGAEKTRTETISYIDTRVAKQMAKLYDEIIVQSPELPDTDKGRSDLNVFFSRLLFCFFAEDTGVFPDGIFTDAINQLTATAGSDTAEFLDELFTILDTPDDERQNLPAHFAEFGYVNGSLFRSEDEITVPAFSRKARNIVVDCGTLDWSDINPDIFGSMIQAVTAGEDRANLGMHYTSIENILKVLNPLFLDDLEERFENAETVTQLEKLLNHLGEIRVFDPACGSGNFLIIAYKRLRNLEHRILQRLGEIDSSKAALFADSRISLEHIYGIEIDDFAHDIAKLSLWFAKHQMNQEYDDLFGIERPLIPLTETGAIHNENAATANWAGVCTASDTTYICGNPPYIGSSMQTPEQKAEMQSYFGTPKYPKNMDYIGLWFLKAADWVKGAARVGFVSTNSVCQGTHLEMLWTRMLSKEMRVVFAHTSFLWSNNSAASAGVTCVVVGLSGRSARGPFPLVDKGDLRMVENINPYLVATPDDTIVVGVSKPPVELPAMKYGSKPSDGGHLVVSSAQRKEVPEEAAPFVLPYIGAKELTEARKRFCIWIDEERLSEAEGVEFIQSRLKRVADFRRDSDAKSTRDWADRPHMFKQRGYERSHCNAIPGHTSERRAYVPMGYFPTGTVGTAQGRVQLGLEVRCPIRSDPFLIDAGLIPFTFGKRIFNDRVEVTVRHETYTGTNIAVCVEICSICAQPISRISKVG